MVQKVRVTSFSAHALERMREDNITRSTVHVVVASGRWEETYSEKGKPRYKFTNGRVIVIVGQDGGAVTAFVKDSAKFESGRP
jgi:hypothetical protein